MIGIKCDGNNEARRTLLVVSGSNRKDNVVSGPLKGKGPTLWASYDHLRSHCR